MVFEIYHYLTTSGKDVFESWLDGLMDEVAVARILVRVDRLSAGHFGDCRHVGGGVWELRIDHGPGYRVYYARAGSRVILLLCGGDKRRQKFDIAAARAYWDDFNGRTT